MKVLLVINNLYTLGNGLSGSARRTMYYLREAGVEVKALSAANPDSFGEQPDFVLPNDKIPIFHSIIKKQGYAFAKADEDVILTAVRWADVVHLEEPFALEWKVVELATKAGVPCVATYHLHPENFFASVGLMKSRYFNDKTMRVWKEKVFERCKIVQCPTQNVKDRLEKFGFQAELRVISNGLIPRGKTQRKEMTENKKSCYQLLCVGRFSNEKDQVILLDAMRHSRYAGQIRLVFAGRGPIEKKLKHKAQKMVKEGGYRSTNPFSDFIATRRLCSWHTNQSFIFIARSLR